MNKSFDAAVESAAAEAGINLLGIVTNDVLTFSRLKLFSDILMREANASQLKSAAAHVVEIEELNLKIRTLHQALDDHQQVMATAHVLCNKLDVPLLLPLRERLDQAVEAVIKSKA